LTSENGLYHVLVDRRAKKDLRRVPEYIIDRFSMILDELEVDPINKRPGVDIKNLREYPNIFRVRIGDYRVLYSVDKNYIVRVIAVVHRKKAYRIFEDLEPYKASERTEREIPRHGLPRTQAPQLSEYRLTPAHCHPYASCRRVIYKSMHWKCSVNSHS